MLWLVVMERIVVFSHALYDFLSFLFYLLIEFFEWLCAFRLLDDLLLCSFDLVMGNRMSLLVKLFLIVFNLRFIHWLRVVLPVKVFVRDHSHQKSIFLQFAHYFLSQRLKVVRICNFLVILLLSLVFFWCQWNKLFLLSYIGRKAVFFRLHTSTWRSSHWTVGPRIRLNSLICVSYLLELPLSAKCYLV
jgi:hypothetical protein